MKAVIYARYSSDSQREESIEGQLRECTEYAERNGITVLRSYIDRALSARTADRPEFQNMIKDSEQKLFDVVLIWKLDRFSRDRYDSAHYKHILKKNGVKVVSVKENISDGPEGIILESMLEGYAEYYSAELSEKIQRGQKENALKCKNNGGNTPLGYVVGTDGVLAVDPLTAPLVTEIFTLYDSGESISEITASLNGRGLKTKKGKAFKIGGVSLILKNRKYIGEYQYGSVIIPKGIPAIIDDDLFDRVQRRMAFNKKAPAKAKATEEYLLTTKLFCGTCERLMAGESGTSSTKGVKHYYYKCGGAKRKLGCKRKAVRKHWIERAAVLVTVQRVLQDDEISRIAEAIVALQEKEDTSLPAMRQQLTECEKAIDNMLNAIQMGVLTASTKERLEKLEMRREELKLSILQAQMARPRYTKEQVVSWISRFKYGNVDDPQYQKQIIDTFINSIYVFDDKLVFTYNFKDGTETITLAEIQAAFGSDLTQVAPPKRRAPLCGALLFGIRRTFNSAQTNELLVHQGFRTAKTLVTRRLARFLFFRRRLKGSLGPLFLQPQALDPFLHACHALAAAQALAGEPLCPLRASGSQNVLAAHAAAAGGGKGDDGLARKVVAFEERLDDARGLIPPDRKAHEHRVVLRHIRDLARDGGAALGVLHLDGAAALFIHPIQIGSGVGRLGRDLEEVAAGHTGKGLGKLRGLAAGGKIGN